MADSGESAAVKDMRRPWCQAADPPVQYQSPVRPCGRTDGLVTRETYGTLYNLCWLHAGPPEWVTATAPRPSLWRRLVALSDRFEASND
jgi:hypothetical protein